MLVCLICDSNHLRKAWFVFGPDIPTFDDDGAFADLRYQPVRRFLTGRAQLMCSLKYHREALKTSIKGS